MPNTPNNWGTDLYKFVGKTFTVTSEQFRQKRNIFNLFGEITTTSAFYDLACGGDFGELPAFDGSKNNINPYRGFRTILAPKEYAGAYDIHYKQWINDMTGEVKKAGKQLGTAAQMKIWLETLRLFSRAYSSSYTGGDGKAWAATDHPNASKGTTAGARTYEADSTKGTYSNLITTELSEAGITEAKKQASRFVTPAANPWLGNYDTLLVSPELEWKAYGLVKAMNTPDSAENAANTVANMKVVVVGGGNEGFSEDQWAICDSSLMKDLCAIVYNTKPEVSEGTNWSKYIKTMVGYASFDVAWGDARQIIFSNPA